MNDLVCELDTQRSGSLMFDQQHTQLAVNEVERQQALRKAHT
jgi:hypothetical protein